MDWLTLRKMVNKQICSSKKVSQMKAILLLQTVSISKILDVETDNVATAGSSEMRRGGKENSYVEKRLYKGIKLFPN